MCLIVVDRDATGLDKDLVNSAYTNNSDGFGVMLPIGNGKVHTHKILPKKWEDCWDVYERYNKAPMAVHFRMATAGETNKSMCHPFQILNKRRHGRDVWVMHNGPKLAVPIIDTTKSDTWHMVEYIVKPILERTPEMIEEQGFFDMMENIAEADRLTFLDGGKEVFTTVNFKKGDAAHGLEFSNTYSLKRGFGFTYNIHSQKGHDDYEDPWYNDALYDDDLGYYGYRPPKNQAKLPPYVSAFDKPVLVSEEENDVDCPQIKDILLSIRGNIIEEDNLTLNEVNDTLDEIDDLLTMITLVDQSLESDNVTPLYPGVEDDSIPFDADAPIIDIYEAGAVIPVADAKELTLSELFQLVIKNPDGISELLTRLIK